MSQILTRPFTLTISKPELTRQRLKASIKRVLVDIKDQYRREVAAWCDVFCPRDTGDLKSDLKESTALGFVSEDDFFLRITLYLDSRMPYSEIVNMLTPPVNWSNPLTEYQFFDTLVTELANQAIPRMIQTALRRERLI